MLDGSQLKAELGASEVYIRDGKLVVIGDLTEAQAITGITTHQNTVLAKKAEQDAIKAQEALDKASGEAKLVAVGLTKSEIKAVTKDK